jgi:hypothetical protein
LILGIHMLTIWPVSDNIALAAGSVKGRTKPSIFRALVGWFRLDWEVVRGRGSAGRALVGVGRGSLVGGKAGVPDPSPLLLHACYSPLTCRYVKFRKRYLPLLKCTMEIPSGASSALEAETLAGQRCQAKQASTAETPASCAC